MNKYAPWARIILRYPAGAGIFVGLFGVDNPAADPDVIFVVSCLISGLVEGFYAYAKRKGGAT